jgi:hypothetical protein
MIGLVALWQTAGYVDYVVVVLPQRPLMKPRLCVSAFVQHAQSSPVHLLTKLIVPEPLPTVNMQPSLLNL